MGELTTDALVQAVQLANESVVSAASDDPELAGMGTTLCAIAVVQVPTEDVERLAIVNVGDSRVYLLKDGAARAGHRRPQPGRDARTPGPARPGPRPRSTRSATSSPGPSASTPG